mmetsp:Transcript_8393/g.16965  ORF Transcript_8393/g.16965 Transcript_8393/m.16965 type:complete len:234 (-) Transcript_8393:402-1103(-)
MLTRILPTSMSLFSFPSLNPNTTRPTSSSITPKLNPIGPSLVITTLLTSLGTFLIIASSSFLSESLSLPRTPMILVLSVSLMRNSIDLGLPGSFRAAMTACILLISTGPDPVIEPVLTNEEGGSTNFRPFTPQIVAPLNMSGSSSAASATLSACPPLGNSTTLTSPEPSFMRSFMPRGTGSLHTSSTISLPMIWVVSVMADSSASSRSSTERFDILRIRGQYMARVEFKVSRR